MREYLITRIDGFEYTVKAKTITEVILKMSVSTLAVIATIKTTNKYGDTLYID